MKPDSPKTTGDKHPFSNPELYNSNSTPQYLFAHGLIEHMDIKPTDTILDIGCGDGRVTVDMAKMVPLGKIVGTDLSNEMIAFAKTKYPPSNTGNLDFLVMDAKKNIFHNQFDIVTSFRCLQWVRNQADALKGIKSALIPGGKAILALPLKSEMEEIFKPIISSKKWASYFTHFDDPMTYFTLETYTNLLENIGFKKQTIKEETLSHPFKTQHDIELFLKSGNPRMKGLSESKQDEFTADMAAAIFQANTSSKKLFLSLQMLIAHVIKPL